MEMTVDTEGFHPDLDHGHMDEDLNMDIPDDPTQDVDLVDDLPTYDDALDQEQGDDIMQDGDDILSSTMNDDFGPKDEEDVVLGDEFAEPENLNFNPYVDESLQIAEELDEVPDMTRSISPQIDQIGAVSSNSAKTEPDDEPRASEINVDHGISITDVNQSTNVEGLPEDSHTSEPDQQEDDGPQPVSVPLGQDESHDLENESHVANSGNEAESGSIEFKAVDDLHTQGSPEDNEFTEFEALSQVTRNTKITYNDDKMSLFPPFEEEDSSDTYLLQDVSIVKEPLQRLFVEIREVLAESVDHDEDLELEFPQLRLRVFEISDAIKDLALKDIIGVFASLQANQGLDFSEHLDIRLHCRKRLLSAVQYLKALAGKGHGLFRTTVSSQTSHVGDGGLTDQENLNQLLDIGFNGEDPSIEAGLFVEGFDGEDQEPTEHENEGVEFEAAEANYGEDDEEEEEEEAGSVHEYDQDQLLEYTETHEEIRNDGDAEELASISSTGEASGEHKDPVADLSLPNPGIAADATGSLAHHDATSLINTGLMENQTDKQVIATENSEKSSAHFDDDDLIDYSEDESENGDSSAGVDHKLQTKTQSVDEQKPDFIDAAKQNGTSKEDTEQGKLANNSYDSNDKSRGNEHGSQSPIDKSGGLEGGEVSIEEGFADPGAQESTVLRGHDQSQGPHDPTEIESIALETSDDPSLAIVSEIEVDTAQGIEVASSDLIHSPSGSTSLADTNQIRSKRSHDGDLDDTLEASSDGLASKRIRST